MLGILTADLRPVFEIQKADHIEGFAEAERSLITALRCNRVQISGSSQKRTSYEFFWYRQQMIHKQKASLFQLTL